MAAVMNRTNGTTPKKDVIIVFCAHSDDQVIGVGGTIAKYAEEGKRVIIVVFSYGQKANPWLKSDVTAEIRFKESDRAGQVIGAEETIFLGLTEGKFAEEVKRKKNWSYLVSFMRRHQPVRIFSHSADDPHPDHSALAKIILELCDEVHYTGDVLSFDVWTPVKIHRHTPRVYIDVTTTFSKKIKALGCFKSQLLSIIALKWSIYYKSIKWGLQSGSRFAEMFHKVR